jgi:hypothetical protein
VTKSSDKKQDKKETVQVGPWISMRTGLIIITLTSIGMAVLTAVQVWDTKPPLEAILWGLVYGALIWVIFFGMFFFNRWIRRR